MLHISQINGGGAGRVIVNLANYFASNNYRTILVTTFFREKEYEVDSRVERLAIEPDEANGSKLSRNIRRIRTLRKYCKTYKPDILLTFLTEPIVRSVISTRGLPVKNIISVRNDPEAEFRSVSRKIIGKMIFPMAEGCVFQTDGAARWFPIKMQRRSTVIPNPIECDFFNVVANPVKGRIVTFGRLDPIKNHKMLIRAFGKVLETHPDSSLYIFGEGDEKASLQELIVNLGLEETVVLKGNTTDVPGAMSEADIFVLSSDSEGMPNALLEAMASGVPSISTDCPCGGPASLIMNEVNGVLIKVGDEAALVKTMSEFLDDPERARKMGEEARKNVSEYSEEMIYPRWEEYCELISG